MSRAFPRTFIYVGLALMVVATFMYMMAASGAMSGVFVTHQVSAATSISKVYAAGHTEYADCKPDTGWTLWDGAFQLFPRSPVPCTDVGFATFKETMRAKIVEKLGEDFFAKLLLP